MSVRDDEATSPDAARARRHALRTPLNHIIGYSELLLDEAERRGLPDLAADLRKIQAAGHELLHLLDGAPAAAAALAPGAGPAAAEPAESAPAPALRGRILVVDDNANNREVVRRLLEAAGCEVTTAADGAEALARLQAAPAELVLLDVMMPVMDGIEACRRIKDDPATRLIPVVMMTALGQVEDRIRGIRAGADDYLTKPVHRDELLARVQTSLRLKQDLQGRLDRLRGGQEYLARFVPRSVQRSLQERPDAPDLEKTDRDLTAMFVDVSGYARLSQTLRQAADFMVEKYFSRFLDVIASRGGDVTETSGDRLMVVFAADDPREHAVNAAACALEILQKTEELNRQLQGILDPISVHIGINSGISLIGPTRYEGASGTRWIYTALGPAVNLAARIADVAAPGTVLTGAETARRVAETFQLQEQAPREFKNIRGEVVVFELFGRRAGEPGAA